MISTVAKAKLNSLSYLQMQANKEAEIFPLARSQTTRSIVGRYRYQIPDIIDTGTSMKNIDTGNIGCFDPFDTARVTAHDY